MHREVHGSSNNLISTEDWDYDDAGNVTSHVDELGHETHPIFS